jgi:hypothetical protein
MGPEDGVIEPDKGGDASRSPEPSANLDASSTIEEMGIENTSRSDGKWDAPKNDRTQEEVATQPSVPAVDPEAARLAKPGKRQRRAARLKARKRNTTIAAAIGVMGLLLLVVGLSMVAGLG